LPIVKAPPIEIKHVEIPKSIENYLEKRTQLENEDNQEQLVNKKKRKNKKASENLESLNESAAKRSKNGLENTTNNYIEKTTKPHKNKKIS